jgi:hypothetical protein
MTIREAAELASRGNDLMKDNSQDKVQPEGTPKDMPVGASQALNSALQKTFEALLQEPVPDKFEALIARIREEEARRAEKSEDEES